MGQYTPDQGNCLCLRFLLRLAFEFYAVVYHPFVQGVRCTRASKACHSLHINAYFLGSQVSVQFRRLFSLKRRAAAAAAFVNVSSLDQAGTTHSITTGTWLSNMACSAVPPYTF